VVRAPDVPTFYDFNLVRVEDGDPGLDAPALAAAAEAAHAGLEHRRIEVFDRAAGERLRPGFEAMGWHVDRLAFLHRTLPAPASPVPEGAELRVEGFLASRPLRNAWRGETVYADGPDFVHIEELAAERRQTNSTVAYEAGEPVAFAAASCHDATVEIELVFVRPERRGGGLGAAVIGRALQDATDRGARDALIEADDEGAAKRLYERLGFTTVWVHHVFTRLP
jgi:GNAT superfamily N-acetyltransferase